MQEFDRSLRSNRRHLLIGLAGASFALVATSILARPALATPQSAQELLAKLVKGTPKAGRVTIKAPEIAENGNTVPLTLSVDSPMTATDYVRAVHVVTDGNPAPGVVSLHFGPLSGKAEAQIRVRLATTEHVIAVAEMSDGSLWTATREIKVTIGGCGG